MHKYLLVLFLIVPFYAKCQLYNNPFLSLALDTGKIPSQVAQLGSSYNLGSNALSGKFYNAIFNDVFVGDDAKNAPLPYLKNNNNDLGLYLDNYLFYSWESNKNKSLHFYLNLSSRIQYTSNFSADAYKLVAFGNEMYAGKTADISGFNFTHYVYQSLQFGFFNYKTKSGDKTLLYGGGISLVSGAGYNNLSIPKGTLYTSPLGDSVSLDAKISSKAVNPASMITDINGLGASLNGFIALRFSNKDELRFQVADLGAIDWFKKTNEFDINKQISYTGENVSVINGKASVTNYYMAFDTIAGQAGNTTFGGHFISALPFQLRVLYTKNLSPTLSMTGGIEYIHDNMQIPEIDASVQKGFLRNRLSGRLGFSLFGYSNYGVTAGLDFKINKRLGIIIGTQHFEGLFPIAGSFGQSYFANLRWTM